MKKTIIGLLAKGYTTSKKTLEELTKAFYPLKHLITIKNGLTMCNSNAFWKPENNRNRCELIADLSMAKLHDIKGHYYHILNRFENGDKYGINIFRKLK